MSGWYQVVRLALDLFAGVAAHGDEGVVGISDVALGVRGGHQSGIVGELKRTLSHGLVVAHVAAFVEERNRSLRSIRRRDHA